MTRDSIQGFIDGYLKAGGQSIEKDISDWMDTHPLYPVDASGKAVILGDLSSYRGIVKPQPVPVEVVPEP